MDCYVEAGAAHALPVLRREVMTYLRRHGDPGGDFDAAELLIGEAVGNAVRHTSGPVWVSLLWRDRLPVLTVHDLGPGFDPAALIDSVGAARPSLEMSLGDPATDSIDALDPDDIDLDALLESGRGLMIMRELAPTLASRARSGEGMVLSLSLPVTRAPSADHDPPMNRVGALPLPEEALPEGAFGKESFLRALVVQLAQTIEAQHGQDAADAAVAQVGTDVGGRMLDEFRLAESVVGRMTPEELGRCYVRLKHAIDGGFSVEEATADRIVLVNDRCPFGDVVQQAPSLCRMTSSVFGGIAARNSEQGASVLLEERIALGDAGCRVVVELGIPRERADPAAHYYAAPRG
ncbi:methanogen output domain 1-containing protein [Nocardioides flavus (ex Wang et al. 2016)]|uniref:methanogen output domain 1-containing protein n=1 Tax=Nocardioides flavus (ex Wang et al. 2016) TaxID=2058780 RepID=UPI00174C6EF7|nr:methanogen output domain 1-containing protein [Nocardioides flavus (ex Wang et al. 2016)]